MRDSRERHARLEALFHGALGRDASEVESYLLEKCSDDPDLRTEVLELLRVSTEGGMVGEPTVEEPPKMPERVGAYRIVRKLGEGGMGLVYLAEREGADYSQTVALKLIRAGFLDPGLESRFREERRILARLEHSGIARFIDGGVTEAGQPFYAMEVFEGSDIVTHCERAALSVGDRLQMFLEVLEPVQYAHQQLVVHRDLKPSNVQVSETGEVKLLDFGVAKLLESGSGESPERTGAWATPGYAAPEQVRGEPAATLADVYALGVILYQLLTGNRPYDTTSKTPAEVEQIVCVDVPPRPSEVTPSSLAKALQGDLDTIVMKAMAKEPGRRYPSVGEFAEEIRRHLSGHPVHARPDTLRYRTSKFVQRNRTVVASAALVVGTLVIGIGATAWQATRAAQQRDLAAAQAARAERVSEVMMGLFRMSDPTQMLGDTVTARQMLSEGTARIEREFADQPEVEAELLVEVASIHQNLGMLDRAEELLRRSVALREQVFGVESREVSHSLIRLAGVLSRSDKDDETISMLERAVAIRDLEPDPVDTVLATGLAILGDRLRAQDESEKAYVQWERSLEIRQRALPPDDPQIAESMMGMAAALHDGGQLDLAMDHFSGLLEEYGSIERPHPLAATAAVQIALVHRLRGNYAVADSVIRRGVAIREALFEPTHPDVIEALKELGTVLEARGKLAEAREVLQDTKERAILLYGAEHPIISSADEILAIIEVRLGDYAAAAARYDAILVAKERRLGDHPDPMFTLLRAAESPLGAGDFAAARARADSAIALRARLAGDSPRTSRGTTDVLLGSVLARIADGEGQGQAGALFEDVGALADSALSVGHRYRLRVQTERAEFLTDQGRAGQAAAILADIAPLQRERVGAIHEDFGRVAHALGRAHTASGEWSEAQRWLNDALGAFTELPHTHWRVGEVKALLAAVAVQQGDTAKRSAVQDGLRVAEAHLGIEHPRVVRLRVLLGALGRRRPVA